MKGSKYGKRIASKLSKYKKLMKALVKQAKAQGIWRGEPKDEATAYDIFTKINLDAVFEGCGTGINERMIQLSWITMANKYYEAERRRRRMEQGQAILEDSISSPE